MRAGLSTIQQTLTPEAATVLNHSISEASRRNHGQTTPLHVAATLLSSPTAYLRQACIKSHPNSSHPLQCRALELCFSVALERLPTSQNPNSNIDPPISNALMAALKRAQAHQRRGFPEQQHQPLLAVKVELEQLIISILDDPSVSRVMREASFSSPAVKATIEQSLNASQSNSGSVSTSTGSGFGFRTPGSVPVGNRSLYLNPRLQQGSFNGGLSQSGHGRGDEVKRVLDILVRSKKRNPVLVGESEPLVVVKEVLRKLGSKEIGDGLLKNVEVIHLDEFLDDKGNIAGRISDLSGSIEGRIKGLDCGGVVVDLGDLKWLVDQPVTFPVGGVQQQQVVSETARAAVSEMGKLLGRFVDGGGGSRVWLIGTATCETYLRCQVYHPSMENDWDLQAVPIAPRAPTGAFPRLGKNGILSSSVESLSPLKSFPTLTDVPTRRLAENLDPARRNSCCSQCMQNYEQDLAKNLSVEFEDSSEVKSEPTPPSIPLWLKNAKSRDGDLKTSEKTVLKDQELTWKQKSVELQKKWHDTCLHLHPGYHQNNGSERSAQPVLSMTSLYNLNLVPRQPFLPKAQLERNLGLSLQTNPNLLPCQPPPQVASPPGSPVRTDLVLGRPKIIQTIPDKVREEQTTTKDFLGCVTSEPQTKLYELQTEKCTNNVNADSFKKLLKGLAEKVWWQREAASAVAATVANCKLGNGRRRGAGTKGDTWLLFTGPDRVGKKKMASALSDLVCRTSPVIVHLGSRPDDDGESDTRFRGKTALDRIAEAVRRNPFSVIVLEDIDEADLLVRGSIKQAMERGRLADSHGREISLGNIIFILTANWSPENVDFLSNGVSSDEKKLRSLASGGWQLRLTLSEKKTKRRASWSHDEDRPIKSRTESGLSFDLNEAADADDCRADGSHDSGDLTTDHEDEHVLTKGLLMPTSSVPRELLKFVDDSIVFKPVDFAPLRRNVSSTITKKFSTIMGESISIEIQHEAVEKILGGTWIGPTSLEEWSEKALVPSLQQLKSRLTTTEESMVVRLEVDSESERWSSGEWLPRSVKVCIEGCNVGKK